MTVTTRTRAVLCIGLLVVIAIGVGLAVSSHNSASTSGGAAPLSSTDRQMLASTAPLVDELPQALAQVPATASRLSRGAVSPTRARRRIDATPALAQLSHAISSPMAATGSLVTSYHDVLARRPVGSADQLTESLESLQLVESEIEPAIRLAASNGGVTPPAGTVVETVGRDPKLRALADVLSGWPQIYGAFTLVEQESSAPSASSW